MKKLLNEVRKCQHCREYLPYTPNPVLSASSTSRILIIGQAPGTKVHKSGVPWKDPSGDLLREWMGIDRSLFYDDSVIALMPMGFCYPGKGRSGDLPPRPECAPMWHEKLFNRMIDVKLTLLIGQYSQKYYLKSLAKENLTETVKNYEQYLPKFMPLPHPSPRNRFWLKKNSWFGEIVLPKFREIVHILL